MKRHDCGNEFKYIMKNNKIIMNFGSELICLPKLPVYSAFEEAGEAELKALLLIAGECAAEKDCFTRADELAASIGLSRKAFDRAVEFWRLRGVFSFDEIEKTEPISDGVPSAVKADNDNKPAAGKTTESKKASPADNRPQYTGLEVGRLIEENPPLKLLIEECQTIVGKIFNPAEVNKILELTDYLRLDNDYILMLFYYCRDNGKTSIHYINKMAYSLYDEGVDSFVKLEEYIKLREELDSNINKLRSLFGFGQRSLTPRENDYLKRWLIEWRFTLPVIERAYTITIDNTDNHKLSLPYLNKILSNWRDAGYKTIEEIEAALDEYRKSRDADKSEKSSFNTDEFFELALKRSYERIKDEGQSEQNNKDSGK